MKHLSQWMARSTLGKWKCSSICRSQQALLVLLIVTLCRLWFSDMVHLKLPAVCHNYSSDSFFLMTDWSGTTLVYFTWRLLVQELSAQMWNKLRTQKNDTFISQCSLPLLSYLSVWPRDVYAASVQRKPESKAGSTTPAALNRWTLWIDVRSGWSGCHGVFT